MDYMDDSGNWSKSKVIDGIYDINNKLDEEMEKETVDEQKIMMLQYEQMLRGLYMWQNPYVGF